MKNSRTVPFFMLLCLFACGTAVLSHGAARQIAAIKVRPGESERIRLRSTDRLPGAAGEVRIERKGGTTEIEVKLDAMKPASLFGGDYNTYVLWAVPPGGPAENLGELELEGDRSSLHAGTGAQTFALLVTAEPHYLVTTPSAFTVLMNKPEPEAQTIEYQVVEGVYHFERSSLSDVKEARGKVHTEVRQAFTAVRLAQRAGAARLAPEELGDAQQALDRTLELWRQRGDRLGIVRQARQTVRLALAAQHLAEGRAFQDARIRTEGSGGGIDTGRRNLRDGK